LNNDDTKVSRNHFLLEINPPVCLDFKHSSPVSDVYAMGIAFYNSVTGKFPYYFPSCEECARMVRRGERPRDPISFILGDDKPIPIEKRLPGIDGKVAKAVNGAVVKDVR
jgi:serine/threonine protein kinase